MPDSASPWWCASEHRAGPVSTKPAQRPRLPTVSGEMAASRRMPAVCAVAMVRSLGRIRCSMRSPPTSVWFLLSFEWGENSIVGFPARSPRCVLGTPQAPPEGSALWAPAEDELFSSPAGWHETMSDRQHLDALGPVAHGEGGDDLTLDDINYAYAIAVDVCRVEPALVRREGHPHRRGADGQRGHDLQRAR